MTTRRNFLAQAGGAAAGALLAPRPPATLESVTPPLHTLIRDLASHPGSPEAVARDETFWFAVQQGYALDRSLINLDSGAVNPSPRAVLGALKRYLDYTNGAPAYTMNRVLSPQIEAVRRRLAAGFGADPEEIALVRNTTEAMQIAILGRHLKAGDEVITTTQDYWRFVNAFRQREVRDGIRLAQVSIPVPAEDPEEILRRFEAALTPRTTTVLVSHVVNLSGQVMPVREIVTWARARGLAVLVDGAHGFAQLDFTVGDLDCDVYGTSLHKWLGAPIGTGMLYIRRDRIPEIWPLFPAPAEHAEDIRKFESIGTVPVANVLAVAEALTFWEGIGPARKEARLRFLRGRWMEAIAGRERIHFHTSSNARFGAALVTVEVEGMDPGDVQAALWNRSRILVRAIDHAEFRGVRVTPNVFTTIEELDRFADTLERIRRG